MWCDTFKTQNGFRLIEHRQQFTHPDWQIQCDETSCLGWSALEMSSLQIEMDTKICLDCRNNLLKNSQLTIVWQTDCIQNHIFHCNKSPSMIHTMLLWSLCLVSVFFVLLTVYMLQL